MKILAPVRVSSSPELCYSTEDREWYHACPYFKYRNRHGMKGIVELKLPRCTLFWVWLDGNQKCPECLAAKEVVDHDP